VVDYRDSVALDLEGRKEAPESEWCTFGRSSKAYLHFVKEV